MSIFAQARADQARTYKANDAAQYAQIQAEKRKKLTVNSGTPIKTNNTKTVFLILYG